MIKNVKKLGSALTKEAQKSINGGNIGGMRCNSNSDCWDASPYLGPGDVSCRRSFFSSGKVCVFN